MGLAETVNKRTAQNARQILTRGFVTNPRTNEYEVQIPSSGRTVRVYKRFGSLRCGACQSGRTDHKRPCAHILAVLGWLHEISFEHEDLPVYKRDSPRDYKTPRAAAKQWPIFQREILDELAQLMPPADPAPRRGRPRTSHRDLLVASIQWANTPGCMGHANAEAWNKHESIMNREIDHTLISRFISRETTSQLLDRLILITAGVVSSWENECSIDGTWFSTTRRQEARDRDGRRYFVKAPRLAVPLTLTDTFLVPAVSIPDAEGEATYAIPLLHRTLSLFRIQRAWLDMGYDMKALYHHAARHGYELKGKPRKGAGVSLGPTRADREYDREIIRRVLHPKYTDKRRGKQNVSESLNAALKRLTGSSLKALGPAPQANEIRLRILNHNLRHLQRWSIKHNTPIDLWSAARLVDSMEWLSLNELYALFNGPNQEQFIETMEPGSTKWTPPPRTATPGVVA